MHVIQTSFIEIVENFCTIVKLPAENMTSPNTVESDNICYSENIMIFIYFYVVYIKAFYLEFPNAVKIPQTRPSFLYLT